MWHHVRLVLAGHTEDSVNRTRPPGTAGQRLLEERCTACGDCAEVCPQEIVSLDGDRLPVVTDMEACGRCGLCADVCTHGAIELTRETRTGLRRVLRAEAQGLMAF